jgi:hypothetical protein
MARGRRGHDPEVLKTKSWVEMTTGQRIAATKLGISPGIRSQRERQLRSRYKLTLEDYDRLLRAQEGVCAACKQVWHAALYVDHDHETGKIRGLLCAPCNSTAGLLDNTERIFKVWDYLHQQFRREALASMVGAVPESEQ